MKKLKLIYGLAALALFATSCNKDQGTTPDTKSGVAYVAITVDTKTTKGSSEQTGVAAENELKSLYLITFDASGNIVGVPGTNNYYNAITSGVSTTPGAVKVSAAATNLVVIANPGTKLLSAINSLSNLSTFSSLNNAITEVTVAQIKDASTGFTMISGGDQTDKVAGDKIVNPYVNITGKIVPVTTTEAAAKTAAEQAANRVDVTIERLSAKLEVALGGSISVLPAGATFAFDKWTIDAVNGSYYPFAEKTLLGSAHTQGDYKFNFYTKDPNFVNNTGISYGVVNAAAPGWSYEPVLPHSTLYGWMSASATPAYCVENTMAAAEQKFENATRLVIKATYAPSGFSLANDWFSFAGVNYKTFADLQAASALAAAGSNLKTASDSFFAKVKTYFTNRSLTLTNAGATSIADLTTADLDQVLNGGEVVKGGKAEQVIRWFQKSVNYYYYEIRHDNEANTSMAFGKYGVVRNNWYKLTLNSVGGAGTPWYPDINNPGPGDPDPTDPIDEATGYLGITVDVADWILWETGFGI